MAFLVPVPLKSLTAAVRGVSLGFGLVSVGLDFDASGQSACLRPTRKGANEADPSPFYETNPARLLAYYSGYARSFEVQQLEILYGDLRALRCAHFVPVVRDGFDVDLLRVDLDHHAYHFPQSMKAHREAALELFKRLGLLRRKKDGAWEDNTSIRIRHLDYEGRFLCERVSYFDQVATNLTIDWESGHLTGAASTLRMREGRSEGRLTTFSESALANNIGTAIMFFDRRLEKAFVRLRSSSLASIQQQALHCTVSGVLELPPGTQPGLHGFDFFLWGTHQEIKMETHLDRDDYLLFPVAIARELPRGGKPQLFFVAVSLMDDAEFSQSCAMAVERSEYIPNGNGEFFDRLANGCGPDAYTYEGWACQQLAARFVDANRDALLEQVEKAQAARAS